MDDLVHRLNQWTNKTGESKHSKKIKIKKGVGDEEQPITMQERKKNESK